LYYEQDKKGVPTGWVKYIKKCIAEIAPEFTMTRMIDHYNERYYTDIYNRFKKVSANDNKLAKELSKWKETIAKEWNKIQLISMDASEIQKDMLVAGQSYKSSIVLNINGFNAKDVGVEFVITEGDKKGDLKINSIIEAQLEKQEGSIANYMIEFCPSSPGSLNYAFRIYPKNKDLAHRQDCPIVKWL